jgi:cytoskeletal protein CcmA (bactofilin family)
MQDETAENKNDGKTVEKSLVDNYLVLIVSVISCVCMLFVILFLCWVTKVPVTAYMFIVLMISVFASTFVTVSFVVPTAVSINNFFFSKAGAIQNKEYDGDPRYDMSKSFSDRNCSIKVGSGNSGVQIKINGVDVTEKYTRDMGVKELKKDTPIVINGDMLRLETTSPVTVNGSVANGVESDSHVTVNGAVSGGISAGGSVTVKDGDVYGGINADSGNVSVNGSNTGDINGHNVSVGSKTSGDINAEGSVVALSAVGGDIIAEKQIEVSRSVGGDVTSENGWVQIAQNARVKGDVNARGNVLIKGYVGGDVSSDEGSVSVN